MTRIPNFLSSRWIAMVPAVVIALGVLFPGSGLATTGRIQALGGNGAFFEDEANILRWYGSLGDYPDLAVLESGGFSLDWGYHNENMELLSGPGGGVHRSLGQDGRWGTAALYFHPRDTDSDPGSLERSDLENTITAMYSRSVRGVLATLVIRRGTFSQTDQYVGRPYFLPNSMVRDHRRTDIGGGVRWDLTDAAYVDLAGEFRDTRIDESFSSPVDSTYDAERVSSTTFNLRSRVFLKVGARSALIPMAEIILANSPLPVSDLGIIQSVEGHLLRLGCGWNYFPDTDKLLLMSMEYRRGKSEFNSRNNVAYPYFNSWAEEWSSFNTSIGVETRFLSWLTLRGSFNYEYFDWRKPWRTNGGILLSSDDLHSWAADLSANLGIGVHLGRYDLDVALSNDYPRIPSGYLNHQSFQDPDSWLTATLKIEF